MEVKVTRSRGFIASDDTAAAPIVIDERMSSDLDATYGTGVINLRRGWLE